MADRVLFISWRDAIPGREERGLEVFNEAIGLYGRLQQDGRIEKFDVVLLSPNDGLNGYIQLHGTAEQLAAVREDDEYRRILVDATLITAGMSVVEGSTNEGIAREMGLYQEAISKVPQTALPSGGWTAPRAASGALRLSARGRPHVRTLSGRSKGYDHGRTARPRGRCLAHPIAHHARVGGDHAARTAHRPWLLAGRLVRPDRARRAGVGAPLGAEGRGSAAARLLMRAGPLRAL
jgi:hypothetical protein